MSAKRITQLFLIVILLVTSFALTSNAYAWSTCGGSYTVQRGDWLAKIANRCGVTLSDLYAANPWVRYRPYIYPGQVLIIPGAGGVNYYPSYPGGNFCGPSQDYYGAYYVVCRGDNLSGIALFYGVSVRYLQSRNGIWNANLVYAGQIIRP